MGGHREPHIIDDTLGFDGVRQYDKSPTLRSERSGLKVAIPCLTPDREEKKAERQKVQGRWRRNVYLNCTG